MHMRIGIDARMYGPQHSGLGRYVEQLIEQLKHLDTEHEYVIFLKQETFASFDLPGPKWKKVVADVRWYTLEEQLEMPGIISREKIDLMHFPHWNIPLMYRKPFVVTIHDLTMFHHARAEATTLGPVKYFIKDRVHRLLVRSAAKRAKHIFATSEFTKQDIVDTLKVSPEKITVTYQAPFKNSEFRIRNSESLLQKFNLDTPYVLYVGNAYPHKNLEQLIDAWKIIEEEHPEYTLVLAGKDSSFYERVRQHAKDRQCNNVIFTGYVSDEELQALYTNAHLYVFPSLYEGFGLPPLEAMTHGVPVVSSNASCMPEVLGSAALYFDPQSKEDMARVLREGIRNEEIRYTLGQNAKHEVKKYSWRQLAEHTHSAYMRALS